MARKKAVSDEKIIAALLQAATLKDAAAAAGISERALYDRMTDGEFQANYRAAKTDLVRAAVLSVNKQLTAAIDTVADIMYSETTNPAVRLQAAQTILNCAGKFAQRLQAEEDAVIQQTETNLFGTW